MSMAPKQKIATGRNIINRHERIFKRGSLMFIEGESSTEMFIIRSGKVRILKQEGENTVELAVLGAGSVLGELSLLDHQPRSATGQVIEDTVVTIIDEELFTRTLQKIPSWFGSIIQLVVKRLRDTMKRTSEDVVNKSIAGVIRVLLLLHDTSKKCEGGNERVTLGKVKGAVYSIIGLGGIELENVFLHLILKEMLLIKKDDTGEEYIDLLNPQIMYLYMNYLRTHQCNSKLVGENFSDDAYDLISLILDAGEKNGCKLEHKLIRIGLSQVELEQERRNKERFLNPDLLDLLTNSKLVLKQDDVTQSKFGHHKRAVLIYNPDTLKKVLLLKIWLPVFREDVRF